MSASAAIKEAADHGIKLWLDGEKLKFAAKSNTPDYLLKNLRVHKAEVVASLQKSRKGMAMASVPERYLDAWARLQLQCPNGVSEECWRQAIDDAGRFLDQWGKLADSFGWSPGDLFDVPRDGAMGLVWWLKGRTLSVLGPEHAYAGQAAYDRVTRRDWVNPYTRPVRPVSLSPILEHQQKIMQRVLGR